MQPLQLLAVALYRSVPVRRVWIHQVLIRRVQKKSRSEPQREGKGMALALKPQG
jgi:hypothetical protein